MIKLNRIRMYAFNATDVVKGNIALEQGELANRLITLNDNAITRLLEKKLDRKFKENEIAEMMIKVMLPLDTEESKKQWLEGVTFNNSKYFGWLSTVNDMKKDERGQGKCLATFIREDYISFFEYIEEVISLRKFIEIAESDKEVCINKDITSRISLSFGTSYYAGKMPNVIVLPKCSTVWKSTYLTAKKVEIKKEEVKIDYNLEEVEFNEKLDRFDGGGIATPSVFEQIAKELKVNYNVEFAIIRNYATASKGLITKFDIIKYLDTIYKADTEYCKKENDTYYLKDMWNQFRPVTENTMILNESMVKLAKYYKDGENWDTVLDNIEKVDSKYREVIESLYVTKINKPSRKIKDYIRTNYQFISALALTKEELMNLSREDYKAYSKVVSCFVPIEGEDASAKWKANLDNIRLFYNNIIDSDDMDVNIDVEIEELIDKKDSIVDKTEALLNLSDDCVNLVSIRKNLSLMVEKKCRELALGKFHVKGNYRYIAIDPISYINFAMTRELGENGLNKYEFYSSDVKDSDIRTIGRNPLCYWGEVHNIKFKNNVFLQNWLSDCKELIYFNAKDDIHMLTSGSDLDGDAVTVVDNETIRNSVVGELGKSTYLINTEDGEKETMPFNKENRFYSHYEASGNLIGAIALKSASVNAIANYNYCYFNLQNNTFFKKSDIPKEIAELEMEEVRKWRDKQIEEGYLIEKWNLNEEQKQLYKNALKEQFLSYNLPSAVILSTSMKSIDAPKTLKFPSKLEMEFLEKYRQKEWYLQFAKMRQQIDDLTNEEFNKSYSKYDSGSVLDYLAGVTQEKLLNKIEANVKFQGDNSKILQQILSNSKYNSETLEECIESIECLYRQFNRENNEIRTNKNEILKPLTRKWGKVKNEEVTDKYEEDYRYSREKAINAEMSSLKKILFKGVIAKYINVASEQIEKYDIFTVSQALANTKTSERFILDLFMQLFNNFIAENRIVYKEVGFETDNTIRYMYKNYVKIVSKNKNNNVFTRLEIENKKNCKAIELNEIIALKKEVDGAKEVLEDNLDKHFTVTREDNKVFLEINSQRIFSACGDNCKIGQDNLNGLESGTKIRISAINRDYAKSIKVNVTEIIK